MGHLITLKFRYVINQYIFLSQAEINQILYQFWLECALFKSIKIIHWTDSHPLITQFYLDQYSQNDKFSLVNSTSHINFVLNCCLNFHMTFSVSYNDRSIKHNIQNTEISVGFCLLKYLLLTLLKSDLIDRISLLCND